MTKQQIVTASAPKAIGPYSQAIQVDRMVYISGQIPLHPETMEIVADEFIIQAEQVLKNLQAVCQAAGGDLNKIVKLTIYLTDLSCFATLNEMMQTFFHEPYPARATIQVAALPKAAKVEVDAIMIL